eukprot:scaffold16748_cov507-Ochromonas_danica.AAC.1
MNAVFQRWCRSGGERKKGGRNQSSIGEVSGGSCGRAELMSESGRVPLRTIARVGEGESRQKLSLSLRLVDSEDGAMFEATIRCVGLSDQECEEEA